MALVVVGLTQLEALAQTCSGVPKGVVQITFSLQDNFVLGAEEDLPVEYLFAAPTSVGGAGELGDFGRHSSRSGVWGSAGPLHGRSDPLHALPD